MTKLLCIDTSTICCAVGLVQEHSESLQIVEEYHAHSGRRHSEVLVPTIRSLLLQADWSMADIKAIGIGIGPGSYTGLRIGLSVAKAMCLALDIPLITVSTLQSMAAEATIKHKLDDSVTILSMMDARRNEVYLGAYATNGKKILQDKPRVLDRKEDLIDLNKLSGSFFLAGDGAQKAAKLWPNQNPTIDSDIYPSIRGMISSVWGAWSKKQFDDIGYCNPVYLKGLYKPSL